MYGIAMRDISFHNPKNNKIVAKAEKEFAIKSGLLKGKNFLKTFESSISYP